ncbi:MAG: hypothetical protein J6Y13_06100 [Treponema sp.]|nr:hypothetical protein [Treponema sp.]
MEIIARNNIFADTSFNRNVVKISYDGYLKLIGQDPASILAQLKSCLSTIADDIKKLNPKHKKNGADSSKEKDKELLKEALDMINNDRMVKSVGKLVKVLSSVYGVASGDVGHIIFNRIRAFKNTNIPSECLTFDELSYA